MATQTVERYLARRTHDDPRTGEDCYSVEDRAYGSCHDVTYDPSRGWSCTGCPYAKGPCPHVEAVLSLRAR